MSFLGIHILTDAQVASLKAGVSAAAHSVETFATNELDKAVAAAKSTPIGAAAVAAVHAAEDSTLSGPEKLAKAITAVAPVVISYVSGGGLSALLTDAETFAGLVIESTLADIKQTKALSIGQAILKLLGL